MLKNLMRRIPVLTAPSEPVFFVLADDFVFLFWCWLSSSPVPLVEA